MYLILCRRQMTLDYSLWNLRKKSLSWTNSITKVLSLDQVCWHFVIAFFNYLAIGLLGCWYIYFSGKTKQNNHFFPYRVRFICGILRDTLRKLIENIQLVCWSCTGGQRRGWWHPWRDLGMECLQSTKVLALYTRHMSLLWSHIICCLSRYSVPLVPKN